MALVLIKEIGDSNPAANSYANAADGDAYHEAHLYGTAWTTAGDADKAKALVMASRTIDNAMTFRGYLKSTQQGLKWPRLQAVREGVGDGFGTIGMGQRIGPWWTDNEIPPVLVRATCELARQLLVADRTADPGDRGIASVGLGQKAIEVVFNAVDRPKVLPEEVMRMLGELGSTSSGGFTRRTERA